MGYIGKEPRKDGGSLTLGATLDTNGNEIVLDADADTSITADTDDQIDFKTGGTDRLKIQSTSGNNVVIADGLTLTDGNLVVASGHGIDFSASADGASSPTVSNEVLSDYEEGTWTPGLSALGDAGSTIDAADYTRVGRIVHLFFNITIVSTSDTSPIQISGLPFDGDGNKIQTQPNPFNNLGAGDLVPYVQGTSIFIGKSDTFADTTYANASGKYIRGNITYQII